MPVTEAQIAELTAAARRASELAYCPYSRFPVGAAIRTDDDEVFTGCNVENASYGVTICAERNAIHPAVARGKRKVVAVAVYTPTPKPSPPCGACRQVINEFGPDALVISTCDGPGVLRQRLSELLPDAFGPGNLS